MILAGIVAGGSGTRMGGDIPKQFAPLGNEPVLIHTVQAFCTHPQVDAVIIGVHSLWKEHTRSLIARSFPDKSILIAEGGENRNQTLESIVDCAVHRLHCPPDSIMLTHDAVRPFVTAAIIDSSIEAMTRYDICTAAIPETDTVAVSDDGVQALSFPDRRRLYRIQTPQTFRIGSFQKVYGSLSAQEKAAATDVCSLYRQQGYPVGLIQGDPLNLKLTVPADRLTAEAIILQKT